MRGSKIQVTTTDTAKDDLVLITARTLRDVMASRGTHVAELDDAIKAVEGDPTPAAETNEYDED